MPEKPSPRSILRGHKAQVHALTFIRHNERLVSGDAQGFVVVWDLTIMRPTAVWRAHENAILEIQGWGDDRVITHGRDHKLAVWQLKPSDEAALSKKLPLDDVPETRSRPWLLHLIDVNTMNFCAFASCAPNPDATKNPGETSSEPQLLVAVPNTLASESIDIYHFPSQSRLSTVRSPGSHGMVMALALFYLGSTLTLVSAYEDGVSTVMQQCADQSSWTMTYKAQAHSQPILSLDVVPEQGCFITSSADAIIAKHRIPAVSGLKASADGATQEATQGQHPIKTNNTKHAGQQSLRLRDDGRIFATGGWDAMIRVYSTKTLNEVAALKWHQVGCYAVAFARVLRSASKLSGSEEPSQISEAESIAIRDLSVKDRRISHAKDAHWLAAGSKDGKISLWDVF